MKSRRILLIDDDPDDRALAVMLLGRGRDLLIDEVTDGVGFAEGMTRGDFDLVVVERRLGWGDGLRVAEAVKSFFPDRPVLMLTRDLEPELVSRSVALGLDALLPKTNAGYRQLGDAVEELFVRRESGRAGGLARRRLAEQLPVGVFSFSPAGGISLANPALARILGASEPLDLWGKDFEPFLADGPARARWRRAIAAGQDLQGVEVRIARRDGSLGWGRLSLWHPAGEGPERDLVDGTLEDITAYKVAEEEISRRAEELDRSNRELQDFAHVVSHDLQGPLTRIDRYARLLADEAELDLEPTARSHLDHLLRSAEQMQAMLDAIVDYSRVEARGGDLEPVDLEAVVEEVLESVRDEIESSGGTVEHGPLPTVDADRPQMLQLLQNLIGNALKFRGDAPPRVEVTASTNGAGWDLAVSDRGIGIPPEDRERIFGMFERLNPESDVPGSGVGLAICKRIAERHDGSIRVESEPGAGSTFIVHIPQRG